MRSTYTKKLSRRLIVVFLTIMIFLAFSALFVRSSITQNLQKITRLAHNIQPGQAQSKLALLYAHQAEDAFLESLLSANHVKNDAYKIKLNLAFSEIDSVIIQRPNLAGLTNTQYGKVRFWYSEKARLAARFFRLKHNFDSLLAVTDHYYVPVTQKMPVFATYTPPPVKKVVVTSHVDTVKNIKAAEAPKKKKSLFARIKDAISNKPVPTIAAASIMEIHHRNNTDNTTDSTAIKVINNNKTAFSNTLNHLQQHNLKLLATQKELITLDIHITSELEDIINEAKEANYALQNEFNQMAIKSYRDTITLLNQFYIAALALLVLFALLIVHFMVRLNNSEKRLLEENKRAVNIAQQKMDLLLHMSHEIRNPLTNIQSFLYTFSRTALNQSQTEMLGSIRLSADMLLRTLNDTLDAAKMESSEFKINTEPFNAHIALKEVIESMEFSATKKSLGIEYEFEGDKGTVLLGDVFRLKQVMVNLLSNAIKYTKAGIITVAAKLETVEGKQVLNVDVADPGDGIGKGQQAKLFSKYYQTDSAKGNLGTGLGLYICKELVEFQKGNISVKSDEGIGSIFSFSIPYHEGERSVAAVEQLTESPLSSFDGMKVLGVDDNDLNLKFLKMITARLNIRFYRASDGREALEILKNEDISVVLTDINMPGMGGEELLEAIQNLGWPLSTVPVIAMAGDLSDRDALLEKGFSGQLVKPFAEDELINQLTSVTRLKGELVFTIDNL